MDDTCAVCADTLEWVAYGICGHKEVCSTCVVRLRFICGDNCCCICKTESKTIFVTKALGDYTKAISEFSVFPSKDKEGQSGSYWYHEDTQSYFDDFEQYKVTRAMCRLSCSVCDKAEGENTDNGSKRSTRFHNIRQLKDHLSYQHRLFMCNLCLKGRKVFICEQKLYTKAQLEQHKNTGDSQVDGTESERGGFKGHVLCKFCRSWFYEDNELYRHMETEHYHCSICKRRNIGKYDYYKNYDDLEIHFREEHFYCEEAVCLSKKFIVFPSEAEMKLHRTQEHAGHMSRARRNAALQLPTNFTYGQTSEHGNRRGRQQNDPSEPKPSSASEASHETAIDSDVDDFDPLIQPFEALAIDSDQPSRYIMVVSSRARNMPPEESAFPPLPTGSDAIVPNPESLLSNTQVWPALARLKTNHNKQPSPSSISRPESAFPPLFISTGPDARSTLACLNNNNNQPSSSSVSRPTNTGSLLIHGKRKSTTNLIQVQAPHYDASSSTSSWTSTSRSSHSSTSAPNMVDTGSVSDFPPISALQRHNVPANGRSTESVKELYSANKPMVDKIRTDLEFDDWTLPGGQFVLKLPKSDNESSSCSEVREGRSKQKEKKTSKFPKARLGNGSMVSLLDDITNFNNTFDSTFPEVASNGNTGQDPNEAVPVKGVWRNGGGYRLIGKDQKRA